jgi:Fic family protein
MDKDLIAIIEEYIKSDLYSYEKNRERLYIAFTFHSNAIEGNTMTLEETEAIFTIQRFSEKKTIKENLEILDYKGAINFIIEQARGKTEITEKFIKQVNAEVLKNTGSIVNTALGTVNASNGEYRLSTVQVGTTIFPDAGKIQYLMQRFIKNYQNIIFNSVIEIINKAADIHFDFVSIHPFYDGNGRTARLLMNYVMQCNNLPFINLNREDKTEYIKALKMTREKENMDFFRVFIKSQFQKQLKNELIIIQNNKQTKNFFLSF